MSAGNSSKKLSGIAIFSFSRNGDPKSRCGTVSSSEAKKVLASPSPKAESWLSGNRGSSDLGFGSS